MFLYISTYDSFSICIVCIQLETFSMESSVIFIKRLLLFMLNMKTSCLVNWQHGFRVGLNIQYCDLTSENLQETIVVDCWFSSPTAVLFHFLS